MNNEEMLKIFISSTIENLENSANELMLNSIIKKSQRVDSTVKTLDSIKILSEIKNYDGYHGYGTVIFIDLRSSTEMFRSSPIKHCYISIHTLIALLTYQVSNAKGDGYIAGYRGDGLFATFNPKFDKRPIEDFENCIEDDIHNSLKYSMLCSKNILESIKILNEVLCEYGYYCNIKVGIGIDYGHFLVTRMGLLNSNELTLIGDPVNTAAKLSSGNNEIYMSNYAEKLYPVSEDGKLKFIKKDNFYLPDFNHLN